MQTYPSPSNRFSALTEWTKNLPKPIQQFWKPMLFASLALHGLLMLIPSTEEKPATKRSEEPVKLTKLAGNPNAKPTPRPLQRQAQPQVRATPQRTLPRRTTTPTTLPPLVVNQTPKQAPPKQDAPRQPAPNPQPTTPPPPGSNQNPAQNSSAQNPNPNPNQRSGSEEGIKDDRDQVAEFVGTVRGAGFPAPASDGSTMEVADNIEPDPDDMPELFAGSSRPAQGGTLVVGNASLLDVVPLIQNNFAAEGYQMVEEAPIGNSRIFRATTAKGLERYVSFTEVKPGIGKPNVVVLIWKTKPGI